MRYAIAAAIAVLPVAAQAQQQCGPADVVFEYLGEAHKESPVATMMMGPDRMILFAKEDGTSWTLVIQRESALCLVAEGQGFTQIKWRDPGRKS